DTLLSVTRGRPDTDLRTYTALWHSKAAVTRVFQRRHLNLIAGATDDSVRQDWDRLQALRRQREQLVMAPLAGPPPQALRREKIDGLSKDIDKLEQGLVSRLPVLKHSEDLAGQDPDALRKLLPQGAVLVDVLRYVHFQQDRDKPGKKGEKHTDR